MKKATIWITPTTNILNSQVIDNGKIEKRVYDYDMDVFTFYNIRHKYNRRSNLETVSLYEDVIVEGDIQYKILRMLTKNQ
jgi:hypothetical protein